MKRSIEATEHSITITDVPEPDEALRGGTIRFDREADGTRKITVCETATESMYLDEQDWQVIVEKMR